MAAGSEPSLAKSAMEADAMTASEPSSSDDSDARSAASCAVRSADDDDGPPGAPANAAGPCPGIFCIATLPSKVDR